MSSIVSQVDVSGNPGAVQERIYRGLEVRNRIALAHFLVTAHEQCIVNALPIRVDDDNAGSVRDSPS